MYLAKESPFLKDECEAVQCYPGIIGSSPELRETLKLVNRVAPTSSTVLIMGETGTGKELIAKAIHESSPRKGKPIVKLNCATLPANLIESELFGHERGSFTGAFECRFGKFEQADQGTIFLDEVGELPLDMQVKLLRVLQEKEIERIGSKKTIRINVRIIAATNRNLENEVQEGRFRADLFYRLNVFPINVPSLRNRRDDIPSLVIHFIQKLSKKTGCRTTSVSKRVLAELIDYSWPGNIRELEHVIERSILLADDDVIREVYLPRKKESILAKVEGSGFSVKTIEENEKELILNTLNYCKGKVSGSYGAAQFLGVPPSTLASKLKRLGIVKGHSAV